jgi:hypothetical protein
VAARAAGRIQVEGVGASRDARAAGRDGQGEREEVDRRRNGSSYEGAHRPEEYQMMRGAVPITREAPERPIT